MQLLYLTNKPVFPVVDGGCRAMEAFLRVLMSFDIPLTHLTISTEKHPFNKEFYSKEIAGNFDIQSFELKTKPTFWGFIKNLFKNESYNISRFYSNELKKELENRLDKIPKSEELIVIAESIYLSSYFSLLSKRPNTKIIVRTHNIEHEIWIQKCKTTKSPFRKILYTFLANQLKIAEIKALKSVNEIFTLTDTDAKAIEKLGIKTRVTIVPVPLETAVNLPDYSQNNLFFLGAMNWEPNIQAAKTLKNILFPKLRADFPNLKLVFAGSFSLKFNEKEGIIHLGFVEDLTRFLQTSGILVAPIGMGSGVRVKLLEAMACGVPIVTTSIGALGIPEDCGLIVANSTEELMTSTHHLITSQEARKINGTKARLYIQQNYSFLAISKLIRERLQTQ